MQEMEQSAQGRTAAAGGALPGAELGVSEPMAMESASGLAEIERKRVEAVVETLANLTANGETLAAVAHDARNMVTALGLYCDLLEEPGVLNQPFQHYSGELRLVATACRRLVEKLVALDSHQSGSLPTVMAEQAVERPIPLAPPATAVGRLERNRNWDVVPAEPIDNLAGELLANRNLLSALAGPAVALTVDTDGGALPVRMTGEDLTRILVNLVKNASEVMPAGGRIQITLSEQAIVPGAAQSLLLAIEDNGPGIPREALERIFESGYTTHTSGNVSHGGWLSAHRGLGLAITRSIVEAAGGRIHAVNRPQSGARFILELPVRGC